MVLDVGCVLIILLDNSFIFLIFVFAFNKACVCVHFGYLLITSQALESGCLFPGGVVTEGSAGSTAISLATVAPAYGCRCHVVIPDDAAIEKV